MTQTLRAGSPTPRRHAASSPPELGDRIRTILRGAGQTFITLGVIVLLFTCYELYFTNLLNRQTQNHLKDQLAQEWKGNPDPQSPDALTEKFNNLEVGKSFGLIRIPAFGEDYAKAIVQGTSDADLNEGPGHYKASALPGEVGNFSIAGHRVGKGSPFLNLDKLKPGDPIVIETKNFFYTYRVLGNRSTGNLAALDKQGIPGMEIVTPADVQVIAPVPDHPGQTATRKLLTLTTCHPRFSAKQRLIVHAELDGAPLKKGPGVRPPALKEG